MPHHSDTSRVHTPKRLHEGQAGHEVAEVVFGHKSELKPRSSFIASLSPCPVHQVGGALTFTFREPLATTEQVDKDEAMIRELLAQHLTSRIVSTSTTVSEKHNGQR